MAHVPKRATQHGLHITGPELAPTALKPGQRELHRRGVYAAAAGEPCESYLAEELIAESEYGKAIARNTRPKDYVVPRPTPPAADGAPRDSVGSGCGSGTRHWRSEYRAASDALRRGEGDFEDEVWRRTAKEPNYIGRFEDLSMYRWDFGRYGSNPRDKVGPTDLKLPLFKTALTAGTTKGTDYIPGYQGYIPAHAIGREEARIAQGETPRSVDKTNIVSTFHTNLVGYAGHVPLSARNDNGGRMPTLLTVTGRDFLTPRVAVA